MGYYKDVGLSLSKSGIELMEEKLERELPSLRKQVRRLLASAKKHLVDPESGAQLWYWERKRWNEFDDHTPEIQFINRIFYELDEDDYLFVRCGENIQDNVWDGDFWGNPFGLELERRVAFNEAA